MPVDPRSDRPLYRQIADELRQKIVRGDLPRGAKLPSYRDLITTYSTTPSTVGQALRLLETEGLLESRKGRGVFVREQPATLEMRSDVLRTKRWREQVDLFNSGSLAYDHADTRLLDAAEDSPPPFVARALGILDQENVLVRRALVSVEGIPMALATSYFPSPVGETARLEEQDLGPAGVYGRLEEAGYQITQFREQLAFRMPTPEEVRALRIGAGIPVVDLTRFTYQDDQVLEVLMAVLVGSNHHLVYEISVTD